MPELSPEVWLEIRALYEGGTLPVTKICKSYDVSRKALYLHLEREGWAPRIKGRAGPKTALPNTRRKYLVNKLGTLFEQQLVTIEEQGENADRLDNLERNCRALELLARTFDRLMQAEMRTSSPVSAGKGTRLSKSGAEPVHDKTNVSVITSAETADDMREELARRLYGMREQSADLHVAEVSQSEGA